MSLIMIIIIVQKIMPVGNYIVGKNLITSKYFISFSVIIWIKKCILSFIQ